MAEKKNLENFTVRVYGILRNQMDEILIAKESINDFSFTKFPGGGAEPGESIISALKREFREVTGLDIEINNLVYITDFVVESKFLPGSQVLGIYYKVTAPNQQHISSPIPETDFSKHKLELLSMKTEDIKIETFTFESDQKAWESYLRMIR
jgi:ADP-ribose pyrophosphatase YjhB (NUDIX family)